MQIPRFIRIALPGFYPLVNGLDALGIRLAMIDLAESSIDALLRLTLILQ